MRPETEAEVGEAVRGARRLEIRGGGTRRIGAAAGEVLETGGLRGITLYEPGALTLVVRAGMPLAEVEAALAAEGQRLAFEVPDLRGLLGRDGVSTIGGVVAANASGPRRVQVGACRDALLGVRFVDGSGAIVKNGGRVMKNVTGYDLVKLMAGARGALGVLTEVSLKVQARPEAVLTLAAEKPVALGLADLRRALASPFDVSGAGHAGGRALLRLEGMAGSVRYRAAALAAMLPGWRVIDEDPWPALRDVAGLAGRPGAVWRLVVKPGAAARIAAALTGEAIFDWGGGLIWLVTPDTGQQVREVLGQDGHATLVRPLPGMAGIPALPPEPPAVAALTAGLRRAFDPRGVFSGEGPV